MMTLQEMIKSLDELSIDEQTSLFEVLHRRLSQEREQQQVNNGDTFWEGLQRFRQAIEEKGIEFTDEDFADLRDRSPGREVIL
jgi:hypothetical protein